MRKTFCIEWPDALGENWMNIDNLQICLNNYCGNTDFLVDEIINQQDGKTDHTHE